MFPLGVVWWVPSSAQEVGAVDPPQQGPLVWDESPLGCSPEIPAQCRAGVGSRRRGRGWRGAVESD